MDKVKTPSRLILSVVTVIALPLLLFQGQIFAIVSLLKTINTPVYQLPTALETCVPAKTTHKSPSASVTTSFLGQLSLEDPTNASSQTWSEKLLTPKGGFLWVQHNETLDVTWGISTFHSLHCLNIIRSRLLDPSPGPKLYVNQRSGSSDHAAHCLDYLAQSAVCSGDTTIEPPFWRTNKDGEIIGYGVDGEGVQHQCRDISRARSIIEQSERVPIPEWEWKLGDTVESVFGA